MRVGLMDYGRLVMSLERNETRLGAAMIMKGSWFQAIIVLVLIYVKLYSCVKSKYQKVIADHIHLAFISLTSPVREMVS